MYFRIKNTLKNNLNHTLKHDMIPQSGWSTEQQILPFFTVEIWEKMYPKCLPM
jgi:hypothetical protein